MREKQSGWRNPATTLSAAIIVGGVIAGSLNGYDNVKFFGFFVLSVVFGLIFFFYIKLLQDKKLIDAKVWWIPGAGYIFSMLFLCNSSRISQVPLWILGTVMIAAYVDVTFGLMITYSIVFLAASVSSWKMDGLLIPVIMATFSCLTVKMMKRRKQLLYIMILQVSTSVTLILLINGFSLTLLTETKYLGIIVTNLLVTLAVYFITKLMPVPEQKNSYFLTTTQEELVAATEYELFKEELSSTKDFVSIEESEKATRELLKQAVSAEAFLLTNMKEESAKLFLHSEQVANLSEQAAERIHADKLVAFAGGWYHEIGRLKGKDYVENGIALIQEQKLPEILEQMIAQHNYKNMFPKSQEAAIIMLSDNMISTVTYLKNNPDKKITAEKIVDNTFTLLLSKGAFDEAGFRLVDFVHLKEFYKEEISKLLV